MAKKKVISLSSKRNQKLAKKILKILRIPFLIIVVACALFLSARLLGNVAMSNATDNLREIKNIFSQGGGYPYSLDSFKFREATSIGGKPLIILEDSTKVLTNSAAEQFSMQLNSADSKVITKNGRALVYSTTSDILTLQSRTEMLGTVDEDGTIITAALAKNGCMATAYSSDEYQSVLSVYNRYFEKEFQWNCSQERISSIALSKNGKSVAVAGAGAENAELYTRIIIFNIRSSEPVADLRYSGTLFLRLIYTDSGKIIASGDNKTVVLDKKGDTVDELVYSENSIICVESDSKGNTVICYEELGGAKTAVVRYSKSGKKAFEISIDYVPVGVAVNGGKTAIANSNEITVYSSKGTESKTVSAEHHVSDVIWCSNKLFTIENGYLCKY